VFSPVDPGVAGWYNERGDGKQLIRLLLVVAVVIRHDHKYFGCGPIGLKCGPSSDGLELSRATFRLCPICNWTDETVDRGS